jgi:hypothetical protein
MKKPMSKASLQLRINRLSKEILAFTDQQSHQRSMLNDDDCTPEKRQTVEKFVSYIGKAILRANQELEILCKKRDQL